MSSPSAFTSVVLPLRRTSKEFTFGLPNGSPKYKLDASGKILVRDGPKAPTDFSSLIKETPFKRTILRQSSPYFGTSSTRTR